jgi:hypothetical protein
MLHAAGSLNACDFDVMEILPPGDWPDGEVVLAPDDVTSPAADFLEALEHFPLDVGHHP